MSVDEIRPSSLDEGHLLALAKDIVWLRARATRFEFADCPAGCSDEQGKFAFEKHGFVYWSCKECGTIYMSPRPSRKLLAEFYPRSENNKYWSEHIFPASEEARREKIEGPRAQVVARLCGPRDLILEVGPGSGGTCVEVRKRRPDCRFLVVEPSPGAAAECRKKGFKVIEETFGNAYIVPGSIDLLVAFEVIEHVHSPERFLQKVKAALRPGGKFIITCPNSQGFDISLLGMDSTAVGPEHLNLFSPYGLASLVAKVGLSISSTSTPGRLDVELVLNSGWDLIPFLRKVLVEQGPAFQKFLAANNLSSHMQLIGGKP